MWGLSYSYTTSPFLSLAPCLSGLDSGDQHFKKNILLVMYLIQFPQIFYWLPSCQDCAFHFFVFLFLIAGTQGKCLICNANCQVSPLSDKVSIFLKIWLCHCVVVELSVLNNITLNEQMDISLQPWCHYCHVWNVCFRAAQRWRPYFLTSTCW